ncbi:MAG: FtsX-like permease family protein [Coriobacteriales bacterium]|jgi:putative ABC transport system permease protein
MKKTQLIELLATIRKTFVSFFSIVMFIALGVGVFQGIYWSGHALQKSAEHVYEAQSFHDFQIQFPYGLTESDLDEVRGIEGVDAVEGGYFSYQTTEVDSRACTVRLQSIGKGIDGLEPVEGVLPSKPGEIVILEEAARELGIKLGDTIAFDHDADQSEDEVDEDGMANLTTASFKVCGLVKSPEYIAVDPKTYGLSPMPTGAVDAIAWAIPDAFDAESFNEGYNLVNVSSSSLRGDLTLGARYEEESSAIESRITELGETLSKKRFDALHADAEKKIADGQKELDDARAEIENGKQEIANAKSQLASMRSQVATGESQLASARKQLADGEDKLAAAKKKLDTESAATKKKLDAAKKELDAKQKEYDENAADLADGKKQYEEMLAAGELTDEEIAQAEALIPQYEAMLAEAKTELDEATKEYKKAKSAYDAETATARKEIAAKEAELQSARNTIANKESQLTYARSQIATAEREIPQRETELENAEREADKHAASLDRARKKLDDMREYGWSVSARSDNGGVLQVEQLSEITNQLSFSMAALFLIVGLLVSYSALGRLVREQITQIGTKKALGLHSHEITRSFLLYAGMAVIAGIILGLLVSIFVVQPIIGDAFAKQFTIGTIASHFSVGIFALSAAIEIMLVLLTTWFACRSILRRNAVDLLRGEEPPTGKERFFEKWGLWNRLPLFTQTMVSNCLNDKRRVFSTLVGVAGCTALVVTAITLNDNVMKSYDLQYDDVYGYNAIAYSDPDVDGALDNIAAALDEQGCPHVAVARESFSAQLEDGSKSPLTVIAPVDEGSLDTFYRISPIGDETVDLSQDGVWVTRAYAFHKGAEIGDVLTVEDVEGDSHELPILGFYKYYLPSSEAVMGNAAYKRLLGEDPVANQLLVNTCDKSVDELAEALTGVEGLHKLKDDQSVNRENFDSFSSISSAVVIIYLVLALLMSIVVLLNLNFMFIDEKKRELIVLMINGYTVKQAKRYISNDTIVLTVIGIVVGLVIGCIMGSVTVASVEPSTAVFFRGIDWRAVIAGVIVSGVLSFIMSTISLRRIPRFNLTDINR